MLSLPWTLFQLAAFIYKEQRELDACEQPQFEGTSCLAITLAAASCAASSFAEQRKTPTALSSTNMDDPQQYESNGRLECTVDTPQKEKGGTKDVFISYLVTTKVA